MGDCGNTTTVFAPFSGILRSLESLPDPAFATKMLGEGVAIDPLDHLVKAPFDGTVAAIAATGHAITLRSHHGVEVLIHVGIDTVALHHAGFTLFVREGQGVKLGDDLLRIDLDLIAEQARDCVSPIIILSQEANVRCLRSDGAVAAGEAILSIVTVNNAPSGNEPECGALAPVAMTISLPQGLHARPAGRIAAFARSREAVMTFLFGGRRAGATSITELMRLGIGSNDKFEVEIAGAGAEVTAQQLENLISDIVQHEAVTHPPVTDHSLPVLSMAALAPSQRLGVRGSPGIGAGPVARLTLVDPEVPPAGSGCDEETGRLHHAIAEVRSHIQANLDRAGPIAQQIAQTHLALLEDEVLLAETRRLIADGASAAAAWRIVSRREEDALLDSAHPRLRERAADLRDVERRLISILTGRIRLKAANLTRGAVLVCDDFDPSILIDNPQLELAAICCARGGPTSHAAILAAAAGIPMLVSLGQGILDLDEGQVVIVDADAGILDAAPSPAYLARVRFRNSAATQEKVTALASAISDCRLADGTRIEVFANLSSTADAKIAVQHGAEGCGLLRTEFLFADRPKAPGEKEQIAAFREIAQTLGDRPFIVRVLDVGGDKPLACFPFETEANPALGLRGIRFLMQEQAFLRTQLRAMVVGVPLGQLRIMLPMVVDLGEFCFFRALLGEVLHELGLSIHIPLGIMVETPAAAMLSDQLAAEADFLSIGTNDLSQYVLAMDRGNAALASRVDGCHPSILRMIAKTASGAAQHKRWLGVCGGLASEPDAAPLLIGLGCQELSAVPRAIPAIKQVLGRWSMQQCRVLADKAVKMSSTSDVRRLLTEERK